MSNAKIYLNVPYAEKDAAKALGAKWDATQKKWYAPNDTDLKLLSKWHIPVENTDSSAVPKNSINPSISKANTSSGFITQPSIKDFVAYNGDEPPWN